jgi:hypothetical protein
MFGVVLVLPGFDSMGVYSGFSQCEERELDGGSIRDWLTALSGNGSDDLDIFPEVLDAIVGTPGLGEFVSIKFEVRCG